MKERRRRHLQRKHAAGTLTYREYLELLIEGKGLDEASARELWFCYVARHRPGYGDTFVF